MPPELSVILPVFDEQENLRALHERLLQALADTNLSYEIIYVDDGSRDDSFALLRGLAKEDPAGRVKVIRFRRNYGQTAAITAGIRHAEGTVIVTMDADLQNDPRDIPRLLAKLAEGYDVVSGWRKNRKDRLLTRKLPSWIANRLISSSTGVSLHDYGCTLKAYRADFAKAVNLYGEMHRFIPAYTALEGARVTELVVSHHPRKAGKSKYTLTRTLKVLLDLLVVKFLSSYATKPIHLFGGIGLLCCTGGVVAGLVTLYEKLFQDVFVHRNPLILLAIFLFLLGTQFILMGLLAEIQIRTYHESQNKPTYSIAETVNLGQDPERPAALAEPRDTAS
jgi:glycosyltransferase involved in cell wall biosynthesis